MIQNNDYKRKTRQMPLEVRKKIGDALRGRKKSFTFQVQKMVKKE